MNDLWYQCKLESPDGGLMVGWIEQRGALVGANVELKSADGGFWRVAEVYQPPMDGTALRAKQANDRNALPSIIGKSG